MLFSHATARVTEQRTCVGGLHVAAREAHAAEGDSPPFGKRTQTFRPRSSRNMSGYVAVSTPATSLPPAPALLARSTSGCSGCGSSSSPAIRRGCHPTSAPSQRADKGACGQCKEVMSHWNAFTSMEPAGSSRCRRLIPASSTHAGASDPRATELCRTRHAVCMQLAGRIDFTD